MLKITGNKNNFFNGLEILLNDYDNDLVELKRTDYNTIKNIFNLTKNSVYFQLPHFPEDFNLYNQKKKIKTFNLDLVSIFEFNFVDYDDVFFKDKNKQNEVENPYLLIHIPSSKDFSNLESSIGSKIEGSLLIPVRKNNGYWELPLKAYVLDEEFDCIKELELFPHLCFQLKIDKPDTVLDEAEVNMRNYLSELFKKYIIICFNDDEEMLSFRGDVFIASSFFDNKKELNINKQIERIDKTVGVMYNLNLMYSNAIRFDGE